jgi:hypothetical protein
VNRHVTSRKDELRAMRSSGTEDDFTKRQDLLTQINSVRADDKELKAQQQSQQADTGPAKEVAAQALARLRKKNTVSTASLPAKNSGPPPVAVLPGSESISQR